MINGHRVNGPLFGQKTEAHEGGNRVPLLVRWPGVVQPGSTSDALVALTDAMATAADLLGANLPCDAGEDSFSFLHALRDTEPSGPVRQSLVMDSHLGLFAIRQGPWKLILGQGGGGVRADGFSGDPSKPPVQLYNLQEDVGEKNNLCAAHPERVARMTWLLKKTQFSGRSRPLHSSVQD